MKAKPTPFCDTFDRIYLLQNIHKGKVVPHKEKAACFFHYMNGDLTHLLAYKDGQIHIRYVPREVTQWLFDLYGQ